MIPEGCRTRTFVGRVAEEAHLGFGDGFDWTRTTDGKVVLGPEDGVSVAAWRQNAGGQAKQGVRSARTRNPTHEIGNQPQAQAVGFSQPQGRFRFFLHEGPTYLKICSR